MFATQRSLMPINQKIFHVRYSKMLSGYDFKIFPGQFSQMFDAQY